MTKSFPLPVLILQLLVIIHMYVASELQCPMPSQWQFRARGRCNKIEPWYYCLFNENSLQYTDFCRNKQDFHQPGYKYVVSGNINGKPCDLERFQPFKFKTDGYSKCVFEKSVCNEEGQVNLKNGTTISDRTCRCDYTGGYAFVTKPANICFCVPSQEDCSCFKKHCTEKEILTPDYDCVETDHLIDGYNCPFVWNKRLPDNSPKIEHPNHKVSFSDTLSKLERDNTGVCIVILFTICLAINFVWWPQVAGYCITFINMNQIIKNEVELGIEKYKNDQREDNEEHISSRLKEIHDQHIEEWRKDDEKFIVTEATRQVEKQLRENSCVLVVGRSGNGKSSILRHHALRFETETKYQIIPIVTNPSNILRLYNKKRKQIFVLDDLWGKERINAQSVDDWSTQISEVLSLLKPDHVIKEDYEHVGNVKLMFATGVDIYNDSVFDRLAVLRNYVCDISNWPLNDQEKLAMIKNYIPPESESKLTKQLESDEAYFPLLCKIAEGKTVEQITMLFSNLNEFIRKDIFALKDTNNLKFCIITLCALLENNFKEEILNGVYESTIEREAFENICMEFNLGHKRESASSKIKDQFENLEGTYLTKSEAYFHFIHTKVYHIAVLVCGQTYLQSFIKFVRNSIIAERFCFQSNMTDTKIGCIIIYDDKSEKQYFDRLMIDLEQGITYSTFHNSQLQYKLYREKFISFFRSRKQKASTLLKNFESDTHNNTLEFNEYEDYIDFRKQHHFCSHKMRKPIIDSAWEGYADIVKILLDFDCNVNEVDKYGRTALFVACLLGKMEVVNVLLDHNADHSLCDETEKSPLLVASREGYAEIVNALVHKNADINQCDSKGDSPLIVASSEGNFEVVKILSARKPNFSTCNNLGQSPVFVASMNGHTDVLKHLIKDYNEYINKIDNEGRTPLFIACKHGHHAVVEILLTNHANISQNDWKKQSPICIASAEGYADIVKFLLKNNADINQCDDEGMTPLFIASDKGRKEVTEILVNSLTEDDLNITDFKKRTPLYAASRRGFKDIVKLLHKHNASIKMCNKWGGSPLFAACREGHLDIVKYLVENGGEVSDKDLNGTTPLLVAIENGFTEIVEFIIDKGADINQCDNYKKTPLHRAVVGGHFDVVKVLVNKNALQTLTDNDNQTSFDLACKKNNADIARLLRPKK